VAQAVEQIGRKGMGVAERDLDEFVALEDQMTETSKTLSTRRKLP
jgi:hypothetical protein